MGGRGVPVAGDRLRRELARRNLTSTELAERTGMTPATISRAMRGGRVTQRTLARIAHALLAAPVVEGIDLLLPDEPTGATPRHTN